MRPLNLEIKGGYAFGSAKFEWGEWRLLSETHNPPAGRNGSSPPPPPRPPRTPATCFTTAKQISAQRRKLQKLSDEQQRKVQKGREVLQRLRAKKDAMDRGAPGVAVHHTPRRRGDGTGVSHPFDGAPTQVSCDLRWCVS